LAALCQFATAQESTNPADNLPTHISRLTSFGERADWSHDGRRILFLSKTFGDAMEIDIETKAIRNLTAHYPHFGYTRALYLSNGDVLLAGPTEFDPQRAGEARGQCYLFVLPRDTRSPAVPLGTKCSEGPAVSRHNLRIAWTHLAHQYPDEVPHGGSRILVADLEYEDGRPRLVNQSVVIEGDELPFRCSPETQNFRPPEENELIFSAYDHQGTDVCGVNLLTKEVINYSDADNQYDEPEGIYPDGKFILVECDRQNGLGPNHVDIWKLRLDGTGEANRLTFFSDYPGFKSSNPVVSDDGQFIAFQLAMSRDAAGVGHGLFIYDVEKARQ
jgi:Tol biopolymer transport system component